MLHQFCGALNPYSHDKVAEGKPEFFLEVSAELERTEVAEPGGRCQPQFLGVVRCHIRNCWRQRARRVARQKTDRSIGGRRSAGRVLRRWHGLINTREATAQVSDRHRFDKIVPNTPPKRPCCQGFGGLLGQHHDRQGRMVVLYFRQGGQATSIGDVVFETSRPRTPIPYCPQQIGQMTQSLRSVCLGQTTAQVRLRGSRSKIHPEDCPRSHRSCLVLRSVLHTALAWSHDLSANDLWVRSACTSRP